VREEGGREREREERREKNMYRNQNIPHVTGYTMYINI